MFVHCECDLLPFRLLLVFGHFVYFHYVYYHFVYFNPNPNPNVDKMVVDEKEVDELEVDEMETYRECMPMYDWINFITILTHHI